MNVVNSRRGFARRHLAGTGCVVAVLAATAVVPQPVSDADPDAPVAVSVYPGMPIAQGESRCTLGYVDTAQRRGWSAGHCNTAGVVTDLAGNPIGDVVGHQQNVPQGGELGPGDSLRDIESIRFAPGVQLSDTLPNGMRLTSGYPVPAPSPQLPVCLVGAISGQTCGSVDAVNNGWFTMAGVDGEHGDSGGPVYTPAGPGKAELVGIYSLHWGGQSAATSWASNVVYAAQPAPAAPSGNERPSRER